MQIFTSQPFFIIEKADLYRWKLLAEIAEPVILLYLALLAEIPL